MRVCTLIVTMLFCATLVGQASAKVKIKKSKTTMYQVQLPDDTLTVVSAGGVITVTNQFAQVVYTFGPPKSNTGDHYEARKIKRIKSNKKFGILEIYFTLMEMDPDHGTESKSKAVLIYDVNRKTFKPLCAETFTTQGGKKLSACGYLHQFYVPR